MHIVRVLALMVGARCGTIDHISNTEEKLVERTLNAWHPSGADLEKATLAKPGPIAISSQTGLNPFIPTRGQPYSTAGGLSSRLGGNWPTTIHAPKSALLTRAVQTLKADLLNITESVLRADSTKQIDYVRIDRRHKNGTQFPLEERFRSPEVPTAIFVVMGEKVDLYRDTLLRYAGYFNEVGEAFRPIVDEKLVILSYALAITYVLADAVDKGKRTEEDPRNQGLSGAGTAGAVDTLIFQMIASIIVPGTILNKWESFCVWADQKLDVVDALANLEGVQPADKLFDILGMDITTITINDDIPTALGLALIPLIVKPVDTFTEKFIQEKFARPAIRKAFPGCVLFGEE